MLGSKGQAAIRLQRLELPWLDLWLD